MGAKSSSNTTATPINNQLSGSASAQTVMTEAGNVGIYNTVTDYGAIAEAGKVAAGAVNSVADTAVSALMSNAATSALAFDTTAATSAAALAGMTKAAESSNLAAALSSQAAANASMQSAALVAANSKDYLQKSYDLTDNVLQRAQDQVTGVLNAVKSNSLTMTSAAETTAAATSDMTQKLLIAAGIVGAVVVLRG